MKTSWINKIIDDSNKVLLKQFPLLTETIIISIKNQLIKLYYK